MVSKNTRGGDRDHLRAKAPCFLPGHYPNQEKFNLLLDLVLRNIQEFSTTKNERKTSFKEIESGKRQERESEKKENVNYSS